MTNRFLFCPLPLSVLASQGCGVKEIHQAAWLKIIAHIVVVEANHHPLCIYVRYCMFLNLPSHMVVVDFDSPLEFTFLTYELFHIISLHYTYFDSWSCGISTFSNSYNCLMNKYYKK